MRFALEEECQINLRALREAAEVGIADIEVRRIQTSARPNYCATISLLWPKCFLSKNLDTDNG